MYNSNPVVVCPEQDKVIAGLSREDLFTVVSEHFLTDAARYADLVLPATPTSTPAPATSPRSVASKASSR